MTSREDIVLDERLEDLGSRIAARQNIELSRANLASVRTRLLSVSEPASKRWGFVLAACGLFALVALGATWFLKRANRELAFTVDQQAPENVEAPLEARTERPKKLDFSDGSQVELLPQARARVATLSSEGARIVLERGSANIHVNPRSRSHWQFNAGPFLVDVTGTRFNLKWVPDQQQLTLNLKEGHVSVAGCALGNGQALHAGEVLRVSCKHSSFEIVSDTSSRAAASHATGEAEVQDTRLQDTRPDALAPVETTKATPQAGTPPVSSAAESASWRALARAGKYQAAYAAAETEGFAAETASAKDVVLWGDVARFTGHALESTSAYNTVRSRFPGTSEAAQAAFALGRSAFDQKGAYAEAGQFFRAYLRERPKGAFAMEARGRLMEALHKSGDVQAAASAASEYLRLHASGPYAAQAKKLVASQK